MFHFKLFLYYYLISQMSLQLLINLTSFNHNSCPKIIILNFLQFFIQHLIYQLQFI